MNNEPIFIISELWTDPMENRVSDAHGYKPIGYVHSRIAAHQIEQDSPKVKDTGWPYCYLVGKPTLIYQEVPHYYGNLKTSNPSIPS